MGTITVTALGKAYRQYPSRRARLLEWLLPWRGMRHDLHWVLQDISFNVDSGEAIALVGVNGAGKSTLLKLITGTTQPTAGCISMRGKVAALLELGMGFHPEFTGRQNAVMACQLLGHDQATIDALMPGIEEFAEIGGYIDQPIRVYSSGMQMRLAFSVATASRPDILIVDEALSVGDTYFQHKSFDRIREFRRQGTTLLLVSHDRQAIQSICDRAILLSQGKIALQGPPEQVMDYYNAMLAERTGSSVTQQAQDDGRIQTRSGTGEATVCRINLLNSSGSLVENVNVGEAVVLEITADIHQDIPRLILGYGIKDHLGQVMYGTNTHFTDQVLTDLKAGQQVSYRLAFTAALGAGSYSIQTALVSSDTHLEHNYEWLDLALVFTVTNADKAHFAGCNWMPPSIGIHIS